MVRGVSRSPFSSDFETEMTTDGEQGHIVVRAEKEGNAFNNFLNIAGTIAGGGDLTPHPIRPAANRAGNVRGRFRRQRAGQLHLLSELHRAGRQERIAAGGNDGQQLAGDAEPAEQRRAAQADRRQARAGGCSSRLMSSSADLFTRDGLSSHRFAAIDLGFAGSVAAGADHHRRGGAANRLGLAGDEADGTGGGGLCQDVHDDLSQGGKPGDAGAA